MNRKQVVVLVLAAFISSPLAGVVLGGEIAVTGSAVTYVDPEYVTISIAISSMAEKATEASRRTAELHNRVVDALQAIEDVQIHTDKYRVAPKWERDPNHGEKEKFLGYQASHDIVVSLRNTEAVGEVVDAVIEAGAKNIGSIEFHAAVTDSLQEAALGLAVLQAKGKAGAIAAAAGGHLGKLIDVSTEDAARAMHREIPTGIVYSSVGPMTRIMPSAIRVHVVILARWEFVEGADQ